MADHRAVKVGRNPKQVTRSLILQQAYEMYLDRRLTPGDEKLHKVLTELGYTTGAGYQIWANQEAFRADLRVFVAENIEYANLTKITDKLQRLAQDGLSFEQFVLSGADAYFEMFIGREEFYLALRFFAMAEEREVEVTETLAGSYEQAAWNESELFTHTLDRYGLRLRAPYTMDDMIVAVTALVEGYALRARIQPDKATTKKEINGGPHYLFSAAFLALINGYVEPAG